MAGCMCTTGCPAAADWLLQTNPDGRVAIDKRGRGHRTAPVRGRAKVSAAID